ncbi:hypothetical protein Aspvir_007294 [Aspergillus viridinutans]|uniref:Uncharacterized protein n=1 Tax=Aspergillus viridinutans TaxID=75553 RepID=A0A9P3BVW2_ASPVI|nr:uncharacterized protein Aspvir_007294 [Aspergillus viridinutans]GIK03225.1 hypothetical protein Aspvir_007294 [Aspergillus viridinutans]
MPHENRIARNRLNFLWKQLVDEKRLSTWDNVVSDIGLAEYDITRQGYDFENLDDESSNLGQTPPILFVPLPLAELRAHPIAPECLEHMKYSEYDPDDSTWSTPRHCAHNTATYLDHCMSGFRPSLAEKNTCTDFICSEFMERENLEPLCPPNPFWFGWGLDGPEWQTISATSPGQVDGQDVYANLTLQTVHSFYGVEGAMHYHELVVIISAMRNRARQFKVDDMDMDDDDEMRELEDTITEKEWDEYDRVFPKEARFPVLMTSYFGPQHGRVFYACMDGQQLIIRQSKIYSFERFESAPIELFTRLLLSRPLADPLLSLP